MDRSRMKQHLKALIVRAVGYAQFLRLTHRFRVLQERWNPREFSALGARLPRGARVFDIGANIGYTARFFVQAGAAQVVACEPDADNLACLHAVLGDEPRIRIVACAVGAADGRATLSVPFDKGVKQHALGRVTEGAGPLAMRSIDSLRDEFGAVQLIKIDVEGFETQVLAGMARTIAADRPLIHVEISSIESQAAYRDAMARHGYQAHRWHAGAFRPAEVDDHANYLFVPWQGLPRAPW
jgi:FkbM family methyltransferase